MATAPLASRALLAATRLVALPAARRASTHHSRNARLALSAAGFAPADASPAPARGAPRRGGGRASGRGGGRGGRGASRSSDVAQVKRRPRQFSDAQRASIDALQALADARAAPLCVLVKGKANLFLDGAPIVYGGAVASVIGNPQLADPVIVVDHANAVVGWGTYNPHSMYRVRVLEMAWEVEVTRNPSDVTKTAVRCDVGEVIKRRVRKAFQLRRDVFPDWFEKNDSDNVNTTTTYRLFNAEGDRLSGACCDVYTDRRTNVAYAVLSSSSAWTQKFQKEMIEALGSEANVDVVVWRVDEKMLKLETGAAEWVAEKRRGDDTEAEDEEDDDEDEKVSSSADEGEYATKIFDAKTGALTSLPNSEEPLVVVENGVSYEVDLALGHKTGFYVDQRENRLSMRGWAAGKNKVLDVCTYTGGFAINAAMAGASSVVGVDSSQPALDIAKRNAARNGVEANCTFVKAEAFKHLEWLLEEGHAGTYDVIVLDPPKLAPNAKSLTRALPKYVGLNKRAMRLLRPGGLLVTCSCSGAVTQNNLLPDVVLAAAQSAGTSATALGAPRGAGADQPLDPFYPEGNYLTVCVYRIG